MQALDNGNTTTPKSTRKLDHVSVISLFRTPTLGSHVSEFFFSNRGRGRKLSEAARVCVYVCVSLGACSFFPFTWHAYTCYPAYPILALLYMATCQAINSRLGLLQIVTKIS